MKSIFFLLCCSIMSINAFSQAPGNVSQDLVLWLKPSSYSSPTWTDLSPSLNDFTQTNTEDLPKTASSYVNYNYVVEFNDEDGSKDYLNGASILPHGQTEFSVYTLAFGLENNGNFAPIIEFHKEAYTRFAIQGKYANRFAMPNVTTTTPASSIVINGPRAAIGCAISDGTNVAVGMDGVFGDSEPDPAIVNASGGSRIASSNRGPLRAYIGDIIVYNVGLTLAEQRKVETYLAIKYGVTLANNYVNTIDQTIYDVSNYENNIIGLGRDDNQGILQKQSHSYGDSTRIYFNALEVTNSANSAVFSSDISYVVMGDNGGYMAATTASNSEIPSGNDIFSRLDREWQITNTNLSESYNIDLTLHSYAIPESVDVSDLRILIDDDGDFSNGGTSVYSNGDGSGIVISYINSVITISNISNSHISSNSTKYITVASVESTTPLPIDLISFDASLFGEQVQLNWETASETNNEYFTVEKSQDAKSWEIVNTVAGAGNSYFVLEYSTIDENPYQGISYYRLKQTDFDGQFEYSEAISINNDNNSLIETSIFPNPTSDKVSIEASEFELESIIVYNALGQDVTAVVNEFSRSETNVVLDLSELSPGVYYIKTKSTISKLYKQ